MEVEADIMDMVMVMARDPDILLKTKNIRKDFLTESGITFPKQLKWIFLRILRQLLTKVAK